MAPLRTSSHSSSFRGATSWYPSGPTTVFTDSQTTSAEGSTIDIMMSLMVAVVVYSGEGSAGAVRHAAPNPIELARAQRPAPKSTGNRRIARPLRDSDILNGVPGAEPMIRGAFVPALQQSSAASHIGHLTFQSGSKPGLTGFVCRFGTGLNPRSG